MADASIACAITPALLDIDQTLLLFQATSTNDGSDRANVRCRLSSLSQVTCERHNGGGSDVSIRWSVAEFPAGMGVQHQAISCSNNTTPVPLSTLAMDETFLLLSSYKDGNSMGSNVPRLAVLMTQTGAEIRKTGGCGGNDHNHLQAVTYAGASVQRGVPTLNNGTLSTQVTLTNPVVPSRSILLYSYTSDGSGDNICNRVLRGELTNGGNQVSFSRGDGDTANCVSSQFFISWEVVQFPVGTVVQQVTQSLVAGAEGLSASTQISPVDLSRTLVIGGGQWASGQLHGEGRHSSSELISEMRAQAWLTDSTTLNFSRVTSNNTAKFTAYVIQFKP
jgi:hypothetical protein